MALNPVGDILRRSDKALKNVDSMLGTVDGTLGDVDQKLAGVDTALGEVKDALGEVRDLLAELSSHLELLQRVPEIVDKLDAISEAVAVAVTGCGSAVVVLIGWPRDCPAPADQLLPPGGVGGQAGPVRGVRDPADRRDRDEPRRLLPASRQAAEAVPDAHGPGDEGRRRRRHDVHLRPGPVRRHAHRHRGREEADPARDLHLEGRRGRPALQEGAHRRGRPGCRGAGDLRPVRQHRGATAVQALPAEREGARLPGLLGRLALLRPAPLRTRPPQDPRRRRHRRLRRRLQHRCAVRHRVARHPLPDHRPGRVGPRAQLRGLLEPPPRQEVPPQRAADADDDRRRRGSRGSGCTATCRGCGCSRSGRCTSRRSTGPSATSG